MIESNVKIDNSCYMELTVNPLYPSTHVCEKCGRDNSTKGILKMTGISPEADGEYCMYCYYANMVKGVPRMIPKDKNEKAV